MNFAIKTNNFFVFGEKLSMEYYSFDNKNENLPFCIAKAIENMVEMPVESPILLFIGSDGNIGDSLAPLCGTLFTGQNTACISYGSLNSPVSAKEVSYLVNFVKKCHPGAIFVVIDAAVGKNQDLGMIKVQKCGIKPGLGVNKNLPMVGDISIVGVLAEKRSSNSIMSPVRLSTVYEMAKSVADGLNIFIKNNENALKRAK